jgi:hypothetical protein
VWPIILSTMLLDNSRILGPKYSSSYIYFCLLISLNQNHWSFLCWWYRPGSDLRLCMGCLR